MRIASYIGAIGIVVSSLSSIPVMAATASASLSVSATVEAVCLVAPPAFSYKTVADAMASAPSGLSVSCNFKTPYNITLTRRTASRSNQSQVTSQDAADLTAADTKQAAAVYGPFPHGGLKAVDSDQYMHHPMLPMGSSIVTEKRYDGAEVKSDTIVLEVTY